MSNTINRYWVSWISGNYADEGCTKPPFKYWVTGEISRPLYGLNHEKFAYLQSLDKGSDEYYEYMDNNSRSNCTICALIDAQNEEDVWNIVIQYFPDYIYRFCEMKSLDYSPSDRFL